MQLGFAFWGSKTLLSAVELGIFSELADADALDGEALAYDWAGHRSALDTRVVFVRGRAYVAPARRRRRRGA